MKRSAAAVALLLWLVPASGAPAGPESLEPIEKDLAAILSEMDAIRAELDRIAEFSSVPKATGARIEIHGTGGAASPAAVRVLIGGKTEVEREFGKSERDAFAAGSSPLVVQLPLMPGSYQARIELSHPYWKAPLAADFPVGVKTGVTALSRFRLSAPAGSGSPTLAPMGSR